MSVGFDLTEDISNITVLYRITGRRLGRPSETLVNLNLNVCDSLSAIHEHYLIKMITKELRRASNLPAYCPLKKVCSCVFDFLLELIYKNLSLFQGVRYQLNNYTLDTFGLPPYIPAMEWSAYSNFFVNYRKALTYINHGKISEMSKKGLKNLKINTTI